MNNSLLFFCACQIVIFLGIKRFNSFAESKWVLALLEIVLVVLTTFWYLFSKPKKGMGVKRAIAPTTRYMGNQTQDEQKSKDLLQEPLEKERGEQVCQEEVDIFLQQRLEDDQVQIQEYREQLEKMDQRVLEEKRNRFACCQVIQELSCEVERLTKHIEQERREHSIELRALLRKEGMNICSHEAPSVVSKIAMSPLPALLSLLAMCQKGLERPGEWPSGEHRLLVRRKFFDVVKKSQMASLFVCSLDFDSEYFLSSILSSQVSFEQLRAVVEKHKESLYALEPYEPYAFFDEEILGEWTAFRLSWENLDDIVVMTASCSQQKIPEHSQSE